MLDPRRSTVTPVRLLAARAEGGSRLSRTRPPLDGMYQYLIGDGDQLGGLDVNQQVLNAMLGVLYRVPAGAGTRIQPYILGGGGI